MSNRASIVCLGLSKDTDRNKWLVSGDPAAQLACDTIARAMAGEASLQDLLDLVQSAFDAGRIVESRETALRVHRAMNAPLSRTN